MKVLMLADRFHPHVGGVEKHLWELLPELATRGHQCTIITERYAEELPQEEIIKVGGGEVRVFRITMKEQGGESFVSRKTCWPSLFRLREHVRSAEVVHCHDFGVFIYWYLPLRFLYPCKKVFVTFHGWEGIFPPEPKVIRQRKITEWLTRGNICIGEFICRWYGTRADFISYGGVRASGGVNTGDGTGAVFVGRLANDTGILLYLEALAMLKQKGISIPVAVCGDGPLRHECECFASKNKLDVEFLGFVADPVKFVKSSSFVFSSGYLSILEAMLSRKLVFSVYDNPLKEDYLRLLPGSSNKLFIAGSALELAQQLEQSLVEGETTEKMRSSAEHWARTQTWARVADTYDQLWHGSRGTRGSSSL